VFVKISTFKNEQTKKKTYFIDMVVDVGKSLAINRLCTTLVCEVPWMIQGVVVVVDGMCEKYLG
jgi:hypothetical protein